MSETSYKWIDKTPTILKYSKYSRFLENIELRNFQAVVLHDRGKTEWTPDALETKCVS